MQDSITVENLKPKDFVIINIDATKENIVVHDVESNQVVFVNLLTRSSGNPIQLSENSLLLSKCLSYVHYREEEKRFKWFKGNFETCRVNGTDKLCESDDAMIRFSPSLQKLAVRLDKRYKLVDLKTQTTIYITS